MKSWLGKAALAWVFVCSLVPFAVSQSFRFSHGWPADRSELEADPKVYWGTLDNGFRYALLPVGDSSGSISMRFAVNVGSLRETEDESGYAHLVEHLAFEGAGSFSGDDIDRLFKDLGLRMGNDVNGFTTHHYTSFRLEVKKSNKEGLDRALELYRGFADGIHFEAESVERQKAIVMAEKLKYDQPIAKFGETAFQNAMKGTLYETRPVVGKEETLRKATSESLRVFYQKWYRPESMTLFVVGDIDRDHLEQQISQYFGSIENHRGGATSPLVGATLSNQAPRVEIADSKELNRTLIDLSRTWQEPRARDSERIRERDFLRRFATELLNERCQRFVGNFDSDFIFYDTRFEVSYVHARLTSSPGKWLTGVRFIDRMIRQATRHGFYSGEIELLRNQWRKRLRNKAWIRNNMDVSMIAELLESESMAGRVYLSTGELLRLELQILERLDKREVDQELKELWRTNGIALSLGGDLPDEVNERELSRDFASYRRLSVEPYDYDQPSIVEWSSNGHSGNITSEISVEGFSEARRIEFENSTQLTFLNTDYEPGSIHALVRLSVPSQLNQEASNPALRSVALDSFFWSGVDGYSWEEIQRELSSRFFEFDYSIEGNDSLCFRVQCDPSELSWFMQMIAAFLSGGTINERGFAFAKSNMLRGLQVELDGMTLAKRGVQRTIFPERPELWDPKLEDGFVLTMPGVEKWLKERIERGRIEVTVVGDTSKAEVIEAVESSLGSLERRMEKEVPVLHTQGESPVRGFSKISYPGVQGSGALVIGNWILEPGPMNFKENLALVFAEKILRERIDFALRKQLAVSYDTKVDYWSLPAFSDFQRFRIEAGCSFENVDLVLDEIESACRELAVGTLGSDDMERYRQMLESEYRTKAHDNEYIVENVLFSVRERPEWISEWNEINGGILKEITPEMVVAALKKWLPWEEAIVRSVMPQS